MAGLKLEFAEGLGGLGEGVGDDLVPVHVRAAGVEFSRTFCAQRCRQQLAKLNNPVRRSDCVGLGGALDDRSRIGAGGGEHGCDHVEDEAHPDAVTPPLKAVDGAAAEFERPDPARSPAEDFDALLYASRPTDGSLTVGGLYYSVADLLDDHSADRLRRLWETSAQAALPDLWEAMRHRRTLIVLDNLDDLQDAATGAVRDEGLVAFLESVCATPYPPRVLTTSVVPLRLPVELSRNIRPFPVDNGLGDEDSIALLRSYDPSDGFAQFGDDKLRQWTERLHGMPYGIVKLAGLLTQVTQDPFSMEDLLESPQTLDELLQELTTRVFASHNEPERQVVQLLALSSVPLPYRVVPTMLKGLSDANKGLPDADTLRTAVRALVRNGGIQFDAKPPQTVRLHPIEVDWSATGCLRTTLACRWLWT